jgi:hypothetical protein
MPFFLLNKRWHIHSSFLSYEPRTLRPEFLSAKVVLKTCFILWKVREMYALSRLKFRPLNKVIPAPNQRLNIWTCQRNSVEVNFEQKCF